MNVKKITGGVTAPTGFLAAGIHAGIKPAPLLDLALLASTHPAVMAGVFTQNRIMAAPVLLGRRQLKKHTGQAIIVNSGNANALTGSQGMTDAMEMRKLVSTTLRLPVSSVFVGSTGVIGRPLPMPVIRQAIPPLTRLLSRSGHKPAAQAIMTTDTIHKEVALQAKIGQRTITIGGMAKGSGMIHPDMATMLAYLTTDASIAPLALQAALTQVVNETFNCISVDGDSSTNDTVLCLANGQAGNPTIQRGSPQWETFYGLLYEACLSLSLQICRDGEGCTKDRRDRRPRNKDQSRSEENCSNHCDVVVGENRHLWRGPQLGSNRGCRRPGRSELQSCQALPGIQRDSSDGQRSTGRGANRRPGATDHAKKTIRHDALIGETNRGMPDSGPRIFPTIT